MKSKIFLLFLTISIIQPIFSCGFYPIGDEMRINLLKAKDFGHPHYNPFIYTLYSFTPDIMNYDGDDSDENIGLWIKYCQNKVSKNEIIDYLHQNKKNEKSKFISYLKKNKKNDALKYLAFLKSTYIFTSYEEDPWERNSEDLKSKGSQLIKYCLNQIEKTKDEKIKIRYAFAGIRLAFYLKDNNNLKNIYHHVFENNSQKNILDYWSLHYYQATINNSIFNNYINAIVFNKAASKVFANYQYFNPKISKEEVYKLAKNDFEKAEIATLYGVHNSNYGLSEIRDLYYFNPNHKGFDFLILREVNKLEDWILSKRYIDLSFKQNFVGGIELENIKLKDDINYTIKFLSFLDEIDESHLKNNNVLRTVKAYVYFILGEYEKSNEILVTIKVNTEEQKLFINQLQTLNEICLNPEEKFTLNAQKTLMNSERNFHFMVAREFEINNQKIKAAYLLSQINQNQDIYWRTQNNISTLYNDLYYNSFFYIDATYTIPELSNLITDVKKNTYQGDFNVWLKNDILKNINHYFDLLGVKYLRQNNLNKALTNFKKINIEYWQEDRFNYLDANPFFTNFYSEHEKTTSDTITYNKVEVITKMLELLELTNQKNNPHKDYHCFLLANAYFNMTYYGNSWIMSRYYWSTNQIYNKPGLEDDENYFNAKIAKNYYLKAYKLAKQKSFKALCLRMVARCENYKKNKNSNAENLYTLNLKSEFPEYYEKLTSNCESFYNHLKKRQELLK